MLDSENIKKDSNIGHIIVDMLLYMLDNKTLANLSRCSKSHYEITAAHRFHRQVRNRFGARTINQSLLNYNAITGKNVVEVLKKHLKTPQGDTLDTLSQVSWRIQDYQAFRVVKKCMNDIDETMASRQVKEFKGEQFTLSKTSTPWVNSVIVNQYLDEEGNKTISQSNPKVMLAISFKFLKYFGISLLIRDLIQFSSMERCRGYFAAALGIDSGGQATELFEKCIVWNGGEINWGLFELTMLFVILLMVAAKMKVTYEYRNGNRVAPISGDEELRILGDINDGLANDKEALLKELGLEETSEQSGMEQNKPEF